MLTLSEALRVYGQVAPARGSNATWQMQTTIKQHRRSAEHANREPEF